MWFPLYIKNTFTKILFHICIISGPKGERGEKGEIGLIGLTGLRGTRGPAGIVLYYYTRIIVSTYWSFIKIYIYIRIDIIWFHDRQKEYD